MAKFFGKYRGIVRINIDPDQRGRIQAVVSDVTGQNLSNWAEPCVPVAGPQAGQFVVPPINALVWIEYEQGDSDHPIWTGCLWAKGEAPALGPPALALNPLQPPIVLQTVGQNRLMLSDLPGPTGGIQLVSSTGAMIQITDVGITITNGQGAMIVLAGNTVTVNRGALAVV